jgi:hypothetical protein
MSNNTRARSDEIKALAAEIATRENVYVTAPAHDTRYYAELLAELDGRQNGIEAYRIAWARYLRRARHPLNETWGGARPGAGRKPHISKVVFDGGADARQKEG